MSLDDLIAAVSRKLEHVPALGARYKFDFGDEGILLVDATQNPATISRGDGEAETVFVCTIEVFKAILDGTQDPTMAYMMGKLKIKGSMGYAMKLNNILAD